MASLADLTELTLARRFAFGGGWVVLDETADSRHGPEHRWGTGFAITSLGSGRWQTPQEIEWRADGATVRSLPLPGLTLEVRCQVAGEHYTGESRPRIQRAAAVARRPGWG
ncbi:hypothetical protein [Nonomuraea lactucae]|uniref:hypothetical protein n=1 Tax=Nonomuraea lactucae TaxID=2249762 RepID=UPI000DE304BB|nr:hypothetical protein [Nonomuraea lactucae]